MVVLLSLLSLMVFAALGWYRGFISLGVAVLALILAGLLAQPFSFLVSGLVVGLGVPKLLAPAAGSLVMGLILFAVFMLAAARLLKKRKPEDFPSWNRPAGAVLGGLWGLALALLVTVGLSVVGRADRAMRQSMAESEIRNEARQRFVKEARKEVSLYRAGMGPEAFEAEVSAMVAESEKSFEIDPSELRKRTPAGPLDGFLVELKASPMDGLVDSVSPFNEQAEKTLRDLTIVVSDPVLMDRFKNHPKVRQVMQEPKILELSQDKDVARMVLNRDYRELMDHPKLLALAEDSELREAVNRAQLPELLDQIRMGRPNEE